jgi:CheY-like chemotaxis protein
MPPSALIVDDEPATGAALTSVLQIFGYQAQTARTGQEAQRRVQESLPDVVLLDLMLPDLHGLEICRAWKADPATTLVPVVVVSARLASHNRAECFRSGACEFVSKPFTIDQIQSALKRAADWAGSLARPRIVGALPLGNEEDPLYQQELNRVRCGLVARTGGDLPRVARIIQAIESIRAISTDIRSQPDQTTEFALDGETLTLFVPTASLSPEAAVPLPFQPLTAPDASPAGRAVLQTRIVPAAPAD